jgi:hypothetical protein
MVLLPFGSTIFPFLLNWARSLPANSPQQLQVITALFVTNRIYIYVNAAVIVALASIRGSTYDSPMLGRRLTDLTEEVLYRPDLSRKITRTPDYEDDNKKDDGLNQQRRPDLIQAISTSGLEDQLDEITASKQALILPLLVSALLAMSVFLVPFRTLLLLQQQEPDTEGVLMLKGLFGSDFTELSKYLLHIILPFLSQIWNAGLLTLFTRAEIRRLFFEIISQPVLSSDGDARLIKSSSSRTLLKYGVYVEWGLAIFITVVACFTQLWPVQNFVNMALAIAVSRVIQVNRFPAVVAALSLLTVYDASSVFLIPSAGASTASVNPDDLMKLQDLPMTIISRGALPFIDDISSNIWLAAGRSVSDSAMGSVAIEKLRSNTFQPGLLQTRIDDRFLGGSLGLGDAVFPSLLAIFVRRFDLHKKPSKEEDNSDDDHEAGVVSPDVSLFVVSMVGYLFGCGACEFVPVALASTGLPALLFIIPVMLLSVMTFAAATGRLEMIWNYRPDEKIS